jgi:acetyl-CoA carboxylase biotin carboxylase subunit
LADLSICIGTAKSSKSYLNIPAVISAADLSSADAIFPGYGFLSENQQFVDICKHHNINFIGPSAETMELMSDKAKAKDVMRNAGMPVIEGNKGILKSIDDAKNIAKNIGYPVILKACSLVSLTPTPVVNNVPDTEYVKPVDCENSTETDSPSIIYFK